MNKHDWQNNKCTRCKTVRFISDGLDYEEPHKNFGFVAGPRKIFYMLNDDKFTVVEISPSCTDNEVKEIIPEHTLKSFNDGSAVLTLNDDKD